MQGGRAFIFRFLGPPPVAELRLMRIALSSEPRLLHILRGVVRCRAQEAGFSESDAECLAMAIDEAAANVIQHTYGERRDACLALEVRSFSDRLEFVLEDWGPKVCSGQIRPRPLEDVRPGGLGTFFIRSFMDSSSYDPDFAEGNRLRMVKYLPGKGSPRNECPNSTRG
jgi:anti-sigma regulatory factor (Ser/Thr protein kinase)